MRLLATILVFLLCGCSAPAEKPQVVPASNSAVLDFESGKLLLEANCSECLGATKEGLELGIEAIQKALDEGYADRAAALRLLAEAYNTLAHVYAQPDSSEQRDASLHRRKLFEELVALAPRDPDAQYELAMAIQDPTRSIAALREILTFSPNHEDTRFGLAMILLKEGQLDESLKLLEVLVESANGERRQTYLDRLQMARDKVGGKFIAEVEYGKDFEREFGNGLVFRLAASKDPVTPGWIIEIRPKGNRDPEVELSWVATPPYRGHNPRYLDVSYGYSAAQAVGMNPRRFSFLRNPDDFPAQAAAVRAVLWPPRKAEFDKALQKIGTAPQCGGTLRILNHRLSRPADGAVERIEWLKFEVELCSP